MIDIEDIATPVQFLVPRDGKDNPIVVPKEGGKPVALTRTTTFIDAIEDKTGLTNWKVRSVLRAASEHSGVLDAVRELDPMDRNYRTTMAALAERLMDLGGFNQKRDKGTYLHGLSEIVDAGLPLPDDVAEVDLADMAEYRFWTAVMGVKFSHVEKFVVCSKLKVGGTPDRIVWYSGPGPDGKHIEGWFIWDLKTGTIEYGGLKMASQLGIYSRAEFYDPMCFPAPPYHKAVTKSADPEGFAKHKAWTEWRNTEFSAEDAAKAYSPLPEINQKWGIIFSLPSGEGTAEPYWVDLELGWEMAELAQVIRKARSMTGKALLPFAPSL